MSSRALPPSQEQPLVVGLGGICLDFLAVLTTFPKPDDKTSCRSMKIQGGGDAANALTCLARLGVKARLISKIADDVHGKTLLEELRADDVDTSFLVVAKGGQTPFSIVMVDQSTRTRTCILPPGFPLMEPADVSSDLKSALKGANLVYFDARNTDTAILVGQEAAKQDIPILLDAEKQDIPILLDAERKRPGLDALLDLSDYVVCSAKFPQAWTQAPSLPSALISMLHRLPKLKFAIVTSGEHGCLMLERSSEAENPLVGEEDADSLFQSLKQEIDDSVTIPMCIPSKVVKLKANGIEPLTGRLFVCTAERIPPSELVDPTGAGDAFIGAILYALCVNMPTEDMLPFAATVAAAGCKELGARTGLPYANHPPLARFLGQTDNSAKSNEEFPSHIDQITSNSQNTSNVNMVPPPVGTDGVVALGDPKIDGFIQVLRENLDNLIGQNQAAPSTVAVATDAATPKVQPGNVIGEPAVASGSGDPRIDGIIQVLCKALDNLTGQNQAAPSTTATAVAAPEVQPGNVIGEPAVAAPEVQLGNVIGEPAVASGLWFRSNRYDNRFGKKPMTEEKYHIPPNRNDRIEKPALNLNSVCRICRRKHGPTLCPGRTGACYGCGEYGHKVKICPNKSRGAQAPLSYYRKGHY